VTSPEAVRVSGLTHVVDIAAGGVHSLALKSDGTVWAWGDDWYGQLGDGKYYFDAPTATTTALPRSRLAG
jgi:alpha-tubulin suppressor-like RCC1 family protein